LNEGEARATRGWPGSGTAARKTGGCAARGGRLEVRGAPDRWVPPVGERERERRGGGALVGRCGPKAGMGREVRWWVGFVFFFFSFFFKSFSNLFQTFLNQILYIFSNSNFHTNFSNYFKGFSQTVFNNFSNIFLNSNLCTNFHKLFHNYF
jgi:hypothetical protein